MKYLFIYLLLNLLVVAEEKPNIVWITSEDNSAHWLGCYGNDMVKTPNLDQFASKGIQYNAAFSNAPVCAIARSTIITGRYASSIGTQNMRSTYPVPNSIESYPKLMKKAGYFTINSGKTDYNMKGSDASHWDICKPSAGLKNAPKDKPFLLVINNTISHESSLFEKKIKKSRSSGAIPKTPSISTEKVSLPPYLPDTEEIRTDWVTYADIMHAMDAKVGKLIKEISESEHAENTIIFYYSDHGGILPRAKRYIFNSGTHVPLMVYLPKKWEHLSKYKPGDQTSDIVSFVDLAPTVLNIAGIEIPKTMQGQPFLGSKNIGSPKSFAFLYSQRYGEQSFKFARGLTDGKIRYTKNFHPHRDRTSYSGYGYGLASWRSYLAEYKSGNLDAKAGLIWQPTQPKEELFNVTNDPWEVDNLITEGSRPKQADILSKILFIKMLETKDTGIVPEMMYAEISKKSTVYEYVNSKEFPYETVLNTAWKAPISSSEHLKLLSSVHPVMRYWGVMHCSIEKDRGAELVDRLLAMKDDPIPAVRVALVEALYHAGRSEEAKVILLDVLNKTKDDVVAIEGIKLLILTGLDKEIDDDTWNSFCKHGVYSKRRMR